MRWSDYFLLFLKEDHIDYGPTSFKLFNSRFHIEGFSEVVSLVVNDFILDNSLYKCLNMKNKINFVKTRIKNWQSRM